MSDSDVKLLWGRAAGICSNPGCRADLTKVLIETGNYNVGEMAHIIPHSEKGPRGIEGGGSDTYDNSILLCPTCHRHIDKSPEGTFTSEQLHEWKNSHETAIRTLNSQVKFESIEELKEAATNLLLENHIVWKELGPQSDVAINDPGSNAYLLWGIRKMDTIIPNNQKIINMIEANINLLDSKLYREFLLFKNHAVSFEANQYARLDTYSLFPASFSEAFLI